MECAVSNLLDPEEESGWPASHLASMGWSPDALYVASSTAGAAAAVRFWTGAIERGLRLASPRLFPWTLANSPTGQIGLQLGIRGPTFTFLGDGSSLVAALSQAIDDLEDGSVQTGLVVGLDRDGESEAVCVAALLLSGSNEGSPLGAIEECDEGMPPVPGATPSGLLTTVIHALRSGAASVVGLPGDCWIRVVPLGPRTSGATRHGATSTRRVRRR